MSTSHIATALSPIDTVYILQILLNWVQGEDCAWTTEDNRLSLEYIGLDKLIC